MSRRWNRPCPSPARVGIPIFAGLLAADAGAVTGQGCLIDCEIEFTSATGRHPDTPRSGVRVAFAGNEGDERLDARVSYVLAPMDADAVWLSIDNDRAERPPEDGLIRQDLPTRARDLIGRLQGFDLYLSDDSHLLRVAVDAVGNRPGALMRDNDTNEALLFFIEYVGIRPFRAR